MTLFPLIVLAGVLAAQVGVAQDGAAPVASAGADTTRSETDTANQAALTATASQTARIVQDRDANARNLAAYAQAQADYKRMVERYEAERAAVARKAADDAEAYRRQMATWNGGRPQPAPREAAVIASSEGGRPAAASSGNGKPAAAPSGNGKPSPGRYCIFEQQTGSNVPVRVCRSR